MQNDSLALNSDRVSFMLNLFVDKRPAKESYLSSSAQLLILTESSLFIDKLPANETSSSSSFLVLDSHSDLQTSEHHEVDEQVEVSRQSQQMSIEACFLQPGLIPL